MPTYSISAPDGNTYKIEGPAGATQEQVQAEVLRQHPNAATAKAKTPEQGNMYTQGAEDIVYSPEGIPLYTSSYGSENPHQKTEKILTTAASVPLNIATGAAKPGLGISQTVSRLFGGNQNSAPDQAINALNQIEAGTQKQSGDIGGLLGKAGSIVGETAPYLMSGQAGTALSKDLGTRIAGAVPEMLPSLLRKITGNAGTGLVSALASPEAPSLNNEQYKQAKGENVGIQTGLGAAFPLVGKVANLGSALLRKGTGLATGAGEEAISQAFKAGKTGNQEFLANMKNEVPMENVLNQAKEALYEMRSQRGQAYRQGIESTKGNQVFLDFKPIRSAFTETLDSLKSKGIGGEEASKVGPDTMKKVTEIRNILNEWEKKPTLHTAGGLDDLKQRLDDVYSEGMTDQAKRILSNTRNAVKNTIVAQDKNYAKTMADYEQALSLEREIERSLSLGNGKSQEAALKKLQSLTRNNVNTDYGFRQQLANKLMQQGGKDLMPAIAGQALNSWTPRGIVGQGADIGALVAALSNPASALSLAPMAAITSPRMMGTAAYGAGALSNKAMTPEQQKMAKLLIMQAAGKANQGE